MIKGFIFILLGLFFTGCASSQPQGALFANHPQFDTTKALVYIYRKGNESGGYDRIYGLKANNKDITILKHGGYFPYVVEQGKIEFVADLIMTPVLIGMPLFTAIENASDNGAAKQELTVEAGKIYYLQFYPIEHFTYYELRFKLNDGMTGLNDLKECKLLEAYNSTQK